MNNVAMSLVQPDPPGD